MTRRARSWVQTILFPIILAAGAGFGIFGPMWLGM